MDKKYFVRILSIEDDHIREGDFCWLDQIGFGRAKMDHGELCYVSLPVPNKGTLTTPISRNLKDQRPYRFILCSRDIEWSDGIYDALDDSLIDKEKHDISELDNFKSYWSYKRICQVSKEAWEFINDYDKFSEDELKFNYYTGDGVVGNEGEKYIQPVEIKCSHCKTFH